MDPNPPVLPDLTLLRSIGGGSYGDVWLARTVTGVYRAVKIVNRARFKDERPFLRELSGITRFQQSIGDQPRQLALMHVGRLEEQGVFYYVMELADDAVSGTSIDPENYTPLTLKELQLRRPRLPAAECVRLGIELTRSLAGLHRVGLIHRDVKPSNIIFVSGVPKLADIGLVSSSDHTLTSLGTPGYTPPEGAGSIRADIFSLGRILYELTTGLDTQEFPRLPVDVSQFEDVGLFFELNEVILRACQPVPGDRYASAQEMLDDLLLLQAGKSVQELNRVRRRLRQLFRLGGIAAAAALVVTAILGVMNYHALQRLAAQETAARQQAENDERLARYSADLQLAQLALAEQDLGLARAALRRQIPEAGASDLRGPEWRALWGDSAGIAAGVFGEPDGPPVRALALAPDGRLLATQEGEANRETIVWDLATGDRRVLAGETYGLGGFSNDGAYLIVGTVDETMREIEVATGQLLPEQALSGDVMQELDLDRTALVAERVGNDMVYRWWDFANGGEVTAWQSEPRGTQVLPSADASSSDGRLFAVSLYWTEGTRQLFEVLVWDTQAEEVLWRTSDVERTQSMRFSPGNRWLALAGPGEPLRLFDAATGEEVMQTDAHQGDVMAMAFSSDGQMLATGGGDQTIQIRGVPDGGTLAVFRGHESTVMALAWTLDDSGLISASEDGTVRTWTYPAEERVRVVTDLWGGVLGDFLILPERNQIAVTDVEGQTALVDLDTGSIVDRLAGVFHPLARIADGDAILALTPDRRLARFQIADRVIETSGLGVEGDAQVFVLAASADGSRVAVATADGGIEFWDTVANTGQPAAETHDAYIYAVALSDDGLTAASGDREGTIRVWDAVNGALRATLNPGRGEVNSLAFGLEAGRLFAGFASGTLVLLDPATGAVEREVRAHSADFGPITHSPDGSRLVTGGDEGFLIFWKLPELRPLVSVPVARAGDIYSDKGLYRIRFSPDGRLLVAMTQDGHLRYWPLEE